MRILTIVGARPQFVKASVVSMALARKAGLTETILHTGQHFDANMSDVFFHQLGVPTPAIRLDIHGTSHGAMTGAMLTQIERAILESSPDMVLVYGDTNSTLAGALAAAKLHVPVAHVEAGLRSFDRRMPEEINRLLTDHVATTLYCPTDAAVTNLAAEGVGGLASGERVLKIGDVMEDCAQRFVGMARPPNGKLPADGFVLATIHRAENTDDPARLEAVVTGLNRLHARHGVVIPLHPRTAAAIGRAGLALDAAVLAPVGYLEMLWLIAHCGVVVTDSGGLQKEAFFLGKPCVTVRDTTEWVELIGIDANVLVGADTDRLIAEAEARRGGAVANDGTLYGGGHAAERIADDLAGLAT